MEDRSDTDRAAVRFPPPLIFIASMLIGYVLDRWLIGIPLPLASVLALGIGVVALIAGFTLILMGVQLFKKTGQQPEPWTTTPEIIVDGIYQFTRNPMYAGMALIQTGVGIAAVNAWIVILMPVSLIAVYWIAVRHEEAYLEEKFGDSYRAYRQSVRRWL